EHDPQLPRRLGDDVRLSKVSCSPDCSAQTAARSAVGDDMTNQCRADDPRDAVVSRESHLERLEKLRAAIAERRRFIRERLVYVREQLIRLRTGRGGGDDR